MFKQNVDKTSRDAMLEFLRTHYRNNSYSYVYNPTYANTLNVFNSEEQNLKIAEFRGAKCEEYAEAVQKIMSDFTEKTGYVIEIDGDYDDTLSLYACGVSKAGLEIVRHDAFDTTASISDESDDALRDKCDLVTAFDEACDKIVETLIWYAEHTKIKTVTEMVPRTYKVAEVIK